MNDERMPMNLYTLETGEGNKEMTETEFQKQKQEECKPWKFLIGVCIAFCLIFIFINVRAPEVIEIWTWVTLYILLAALFVLSINKIKKIMNAK